MLSAAADAFRSDHHRHRRTQSEKPNRSDSTTKKSNLTASQERLEGTEKTLQNLEDFGLLNPRKRDDSRRAGSRQAQRSASTSTPTPTQSNSTSNESKNAARRPTFAPLPEPQTRNQTEPYRSSTTSELLRRERAVTRANSTRDRAKRHLGYASRIRQHYNVPPIYSHYKQTSLDWRSGRSTAGMMEVERSRTRRERTFIGSECAVCEEPLEHTLRGERILQFSCGHVSHEACFYEYIKEIDSQYCPTCNAPLGLDTSRGGNVLDLEKLSNIVRSVAQSNESRSEPDQRSSQNTPTPTQWDNQTVRDVPRSRENSVNRAHARDSRDSQQMSSYSQPTGRERYQSVPQSTRTHARNNSTSTGQQDYGEPGRLHHYDVDAMESDLSSPRISLKKSPIAAPQITVRSEYPTLTRSKQSQPLTCLITVEVPEGKWRPNPEDLRPAPPLPNIHDQMHDHEKEVVVSAPTPENGSSSHEWDETPQELDEITEDLRERVENWHGLDFARFGKLSRHGTLAVSRDRSSWQELECFLFAEMLICIKERRGAAPLYADGNSKRKLTKCTLRGSILIKKHLRHVESQPSEAILSLSLAVQELSKFHLRFQSQGQLEAWKRSLLDLINPPVTPKAPEPDLDQTTTDEEDWNRNRNPRVSSGISSWGAGRSAVTAPTEYTTNGRFSYAGIPGTVHVPIDLVVVIPVSSSMQGLKITLLRDALRFMVQNLGERDRMGLVTFGSSQGGVPLVGMTTKAWGGWNKILGSIRPVGQKSLRADVVEGANVAMDLLMQRKSNNSISSILLISDSSTTDGEGVDFVTSRAEAAKVTIHSFGLGLTHNPTTMIDLSSKTKASYTYVKDWMMLRECLAGCLGSLQTTSHQNSKLRLRLPEGSPARFHKISGALTTVKRLAGREAECNLGDLRFGDKRDILVQLFISPETAPEEQMPQDQWETIISGLEALGGSEDNEARAPSVEEVPLVQADIVYGDIIRDGASSTSRPSLLTITMLPQNARAAKSNGRPPTPPIPPHTSIVQRRMELLTSDMLNRGLYLVSRGQQERAQHLLNETRSILKGLAKGGLPPLPPGGPSREAKEKTAREPKESDSPDSTPMIPRKESLAPSAAGTDNTGDGASSTGSGSGAGGSGPVGTGIERQASPARLPEMPSFANASSIDAATLTALETELDSALEWINHPAVFGRDSRKAVLQAIGVISSQRAYTFRTPAESLWAGRIAGTKTLTSKSREWREVVEDESLTEEA